MLPQLHSYCCHPLHVTICFYLKRTYSFPYPSPESREPILLSVCGILCVCLCVYGGGYCFIHPSHTSHTSRRFSMLWTEEYKIEMKHEIQEACWKQHLTEGPILFIRNVTILTLAHGRWQFSHLGKSRRKIVFTET